jgi:cytochrome c556
MHRNLSRTVDIQTAVVQGDLQKAHRAATWLVEREGEMLFPAEARGYEADMIELAGQIQTADEIRQVASQTGRLAAACGSCHQATGVGPKFVVGSPSPRGESQEAQMVRHLWAADRLWEGLIGPSDDAWMAGARAMAETRSDMARAFRASSSGGGPERLLQDVNRLATEALNAQGQEARADVYGRLLETCNRCHASAGIQVEK